MRRDRLRGLLRKYRSGRIAFIIVGGVVKGARVCQKCAKDGVLLVAAKPAVTRTVEKGAPVAAEVLKNLKTQLRGLKAVPRANNEVDDAYMDGKVEGMENAIAALGGRA